MNTNEVPQHCLPITQGMDTGQIGEIGAGWYSFLRAVLSAERTIEQRRNARQQAREDTHSEHTKAA